MAEYAQYVIGCIVVIEKI